MAVRDQRLGSSLMRVSRKVNRLQHGEQLTLLQSKPFTLWLLVYLGHHKAALRGSEEEWVSSHVNGQACHQAEEQGTFPWLSVSLAHHNSGMHICPPHALRKEQLTL